MKIKYFSIAMSLMIYSHVIFGSTQQGTLDDLLVEDLLVKTPTVLEYIARMEAMAERGFSPVFARTNAAYYAHESLNNESQISMPNVSKDDRKQLCNYRQKIFFEAYQNKCASLE
jgi:hypothetical protein